MRPMLRSDRNHSCMALGVNAQLHPSPPWHETFACLQTPRCAAETQRSSVHLIACRRTDPALDLQIPWSELSPHVDEALLIRHDRDVLPRHRVHIEAEHCNGLFPVRYLRLQCGSVLAATSACDGAHAA